MKHASSPTRAAVPRTLTVLLLAMVLTSVLAPAASAQIGGASGIGGAISTVTEPIVGGDDKPASNDTAGSLVGEITAPLTEPEPGGADDGSNPIEDVTEAVNDAVDKSKQAAAEAGDKAGGALGGIGGTVGGIKDTVDRTANGLTGHDKKKHKPQDHKNRTHGHHNSTAPATRQTEEVLGSTLASALAADGKRLAAALTQGDSIVTSSSSDNESTVNQIARVLSEAVAPGAVFPVMLIMLVAAFLMVQNRIDSKDPKLALAPLDSEHDLLSFT